MKDTLATKNNSDSQSRIPSLAENVNQEKKSAPKKSKGKNQHTPKYGKSHMIIPTDDMDWVLQQKPAVYRLWSECWRCDPYGSRWMQLNTTLKRSAFMQAKKVLELQGLFIFKPDKSIRDGRETVCWLVQNLHGSRVKAFWEESVVSKTQSTDSDCNPTKLESESTPQEYKSTPMDSIDNETESQQAFRPPSVTSQEHFSNSSKELLKCVELKFPPATAKSAGASPHEVQSQEEELTEEEMYVQIAGIYQGVCPSVKALNQGLKMQAYRPTVIAFLTCRGKEFGLQIVNKRVQQVQDSSIVT